MSTPSPEREPFDLRDALPSLEGEGWRDDLRHRLYALIGLRKARRHFAEAVEDTSREAFAAAVHAFGLRVDPAAFLRAVPATGPVIVMANHPFGGADALSLGALCRALRPDDMLLMANASAARLPVLGGFMLPLSIFGDEESARRNAASLKRSLLHLRKGGLLAVFPSGEVASWRRDAVKEGPWSPHLAALALKTGATVVPLRFFGRTPAWLHLAGGVHPLLRTALLPHVLHWMRGTTVEYGVGEPVPPALLAAQPDPAAFLRARMLAI